MLSYGLFQIADTVSTAAAGGLTSEQISSVSSAMTDTVNGVVSTFVSLVPIIALTTGAIFGIRFIKNRFHKVEKQG